jgi:Glycosyl transferase family 2
MQLGIHTVFLLRENILFLEEWLDYHASIGFDVFFLYDNSNSSGKDDSSITFNKYGYHIARITSGISDSQLREEFDRIMHRVSAKIVHVKWEPLDAHGDVRYGQQASIVHYISNYGHMSDWTAFIDMDEFIYSAGDIKLTLSGHDARGVGDVVLLQKKFDDRFNHLTIPVTQIIDCIEGIDTTLWAPKHIITNEKIHIDKSDSWNVHGIPTQRCGCSTPDIQDMRFNHYNVNAVQLQWTKSFYNTADNITLNAQCDQLANSYAYNKPLLSDVLTSQVAGPAKASSFTARPQL